MFSKMSSPQEQQEVRINFEAHPWPGFSKRFTKVATIGSVRAAIASNLRVDPANVALVHNGVQLTNDAATVGSTGLTNGSLITIDCPNSQNPLAVLERQHALLDAQARTRAPAAARQTIPVATRPRVATLEFNSPHSPLTQLLTVNLTDTISDVKLRISAQVRLNPGNFELVFGGAMLDPNRTVESYGLVSGSRISYVVRLNTSRVGQPPHPLQPVLETFRSARVVPLPPLPENGRVATRPEIRSGISTNAKELLRRGIYAFVVVPGPNGTKRCLLLNQEQANIVKAIRDTQAAEGHRVIRNSSEEEMLYASGIVLAASSSSASSSAAPAAAPASSSSSSSSSAAPTAAPASSSSSSSTSSAALASSSAALASSSAAPASYSSSSSSTSSAALASSSSASAPNQPDTEMAAARALIELSQPQSAIAQLVAMMRAAKPRFPTKRPSDK